MIESLIDSFYAFLDNLGYGHPVHPTMVHMPIGLVTGAFVFAWVALLFRRRVLIPSARHAFILALVFFFPVVLFGLMDWHRFYAGAWLFPIKMKLILAGILLVLLFIGIILARRTDGAYRSLLPIYTLSFLVVVGLGYFGGELVYGGRVPPHPKEYRTGAKLYASRCVGCHPHGGNILTPNLPLRIAPQLSEFKDFLAFLRDPRMPDGSVGFMPAFDPSRVSDQQAKALYDYIVDVLEKPKRM